MFNGLGKYTREARIQTRLTVPLLFAQISVAAMGFVDMVMTGAVGPIDMAAVAIGGTIWFPLTFFCVGVLRALHPAIAKLRGEGRIDDTAHVLFQGVFLALILTFFLIPAICFAAFFLKRFNIDRQLIALVGDYLYAIVWGGPAFLCFTAVQYYLEGLGYVRPSMFVGFVGLALNITFNYIFVFGSFGAPALGGAGAGLATAITYWGMLGFILLALFVIKELPSLHYEKASSFFDWALIKKLLRVGFPGGLALFFEVTIFAIVGLLVAPLGVVVVAGNQVALSFSSLVFIFPYALSMVTTIRVGYSLGKGSYEMLRSAIRVSLGLGFLMSLVTALATLIFRHEIVKLYNNDPETLKIAVELMFLAATYQCADAIQAVTMGVLRGYNDTKFVFIIALVAYWLVALPVGYSLAMTSWITAPMGVKGFWVAIVLGIVLAAILGVFRMSFLERRFLANSVNA